MAPLPLPTFAAVFLINCAISTYVDHGQSVIDIYSYCDPTPNSEIHQNNGLYYIKPRVDGPVIPVICSNGFTMIDPSLDMNLKTLPYFLSSWDYSRISADYIMPDLDDASTFRQWWRPANEYTAFRVAPQCQSCESATDGNVYRDVAYYTDGANFCYDSPGTAENPCEQQLNENACNQCDDGSFDRNQAEYWSQCSALQMSADTAIAHTLDMRVNGQLVYRPVMSRTRSACTCYQMSASQVPNRYAIHINELPKVTLLSQQPQPDGTSLKDTLAYIHPFIVFDTSEQDEAEDDASSDTSIIDCSSNVHYLSSADFMSGTYRIRECGEYILTEDIACEFNAPSQTEQNSDDFSPNSVGGDDLYWFPTLEQSTDDYPGLYTYRGAYSLGFFAAITVEADDVVIDLNGFTLAMSERFYVVQRFFSLIELAAKPFLPEQGPSTWGVLDTFYPQNVEIKGPGTIGLSSHHGIHGNSVRNLYVHDLTVHHFDVAGIALNGAQYVILENLMVGPQNDDIPTLGRYTQSRAFLPRLKELNDQFGDVEVQFYGREPTTVSALCLRLVRQMDMVYFHALDDEDGTAMAEFDEAEWTAAQKLFVNSKGWMDGGTSYGIVINGEGAAVDAIGSATRNTHHIQVSNVEVWGIYNAGIETIQLSVQNGVVSRGVLLDVTDWMAVVDQMEDRYATQYVGDAFTDVKFVVNRLMQSYYYRNTLFIHPIEDQFVFDGNTEETEYPFVKMFPNLSSADDADDANDTMRGCGADIQQHAPKGSIGVLVNGAKNAVFDSIYVHDIYNSADLGTDVCGPYTSGSYMATHSHGMLIDFASGTIQNLHIENVASDNGPANGLNIYQECDLRLQMVLVRGVNAGTQLENAMVKNALSAPNAIPRACAVLVDDDALIEFIDGEDVDNVRFDSVNGYEVCQQFPIQTDQNIDQDNPKTLSTKYGTYFRIAIAMVVCLLVAIIGYIVCKITSHRPEEQVAELRPLLHKRLVIHSYVS